MGREGCLISEVETETSPPKTESGEAESKRRRHGSDPLAFAILQWPALIGIFNLPNIWWGIGLKVLLGLWWLALQSASFRGSYAARPDFGFLILCLNGAFAGAWLAWPHWGTWIWTTVGLFLLLAGVGVARQLHVKDKVPGPPD
jgi:hypothetical protein